MQNKIAERRANYKAEMGKLALQDWLLSQQLDGIDKKIRLLSGAADEAEISATDLDTLQAVVQAHTEAAAAVKDSAKPAPAKTVGVKPKTKAKE